MAVIDLEVRWGGGEVVNVELGALEMSLAEKVVWERWVGGEGAKGGAGDGGEMVREG